MSYLSVIPFSSLCWLSKSNWLDNLNPIFCLSSPMILLKSQMPSLLPNSGHKYLQISPEKSSSQNVSLPLCNFCLFGTWTPQRPQVVLVALWCRTRARVRQMRHLGWKIKKHWLYKLKQSTIFFLIYVLIIEGFWAMLVSHIRNHSQLTTAANRWDIFADSISLTQLPELNGPPGYKRKLIHQACISIESHSKLIDVCSA